MKILAIRFVRLGDVILLLPALASLKDKFPHSELTLLTGHRCAPLQDGLLHRRVRVKAGRDFRLPLQ